MQNKEKKLFLNLCSFKHNNQHELELLLQQGAATPCVLGYIFSNRMPAVAYGVLKNHHLLTYLDREFKNSLKNAYLQNIQKNESFFKSLYWLSDLLQTHKGKYAFLKGAWLCQWYPKGYRTSNDVDILVAANDVTDIGITLSKAGFKQGYLKNENFVPATRAEIIASKMLRGETVPYIKQVDLPFMKYFEVDINFSLDYKTSDPNTVSELLYRAVEVQNAKAPIVILDRYDFLIHLCSHLYKEATTYPWVEMHRDMTLYKFCDLYALLSEFEEQDYFSLFKRAEEMDMQNICYFALYMTKELFDIHSEPLARCLKYMCTDPKILDLVINPSEKKRYSYQEKNIKNRFFSEDRKSLLKEV